jgi:hypothetical protein
MALSLHFSLYLLFCKLNGILILTLTALHLTILVLNTLIQIITIEWFWVIIIVINFIWVLLRNIVAQLIFLIWFLVRVHQIISTYSTHLMDALLSFARLSFLEQSMHHLIFRLFLFLRISRSWMFSWVVYAFLTLHFIYYVILIHVLRNDFSWISHCWDVSVLTIVFFTCHEVHLVTDSIFCVLIGLDSKSDEFSSFLSLLF